MSATVITNASITIDGKDLSSACSSVTIEHSADVIEVTTYGNKAKRRTTGLKDASLSCDFYQDFALVDKNLYPLVSAPSFTITVLADKDKSVSETNPKYEGKFILPSYSPISGSVGEASTVSVSFEADGELTRTVS